MITQNGPEYATAFLRKIWRTEEPESWNYKGSLSIESPFNTSFCDIQPGPSSTAALGAVGDVNAWFCPALLYKNACNRRKSSIAGSWCAWVDLDEPTELPKLFELITDALPPRSHPDIILESSPGRFHIYWKLDTFTRNDRLENINARLIHVLGADESGWDCTQLLRLPLGINQKEERHKFRPHVVWENTGSGVPQWA
ncbi:DNA-primase RepB domain-containing protein [Streptomyces sp. O3]